MACLLYLRLPSNNDTSRLQGEKEVDFSCFLAFQRQRLPYASTAIRVRKTCR
jgi:hypothetical protein